MTSACDCDIAWVGKSAGDPVGALSAANKKAGWNMTKTLLKRVGELSKQKSEKAKGSARLFVVAHQAEIQKILSQKHDVKVLWEVLHQEGRVTCSYARFCEALRKYMPKLSNQSDSSNQKASPPAKAVKPPPISSPANAEGFLFNPIPRKEELY